MHSPRLENSSGPAYLRALTGIRALAALLVLGLHIEQNLPVGIDTIFPFFSRGYLGVDFFFVLSGFIITHVYLGSLSHFDGRAIRIFLWHRFVRLYPVHVAVLACLVALILSARAAGVPLNNPQDWRASDLFWQFTLLHAWGVIDKPTWNAPSWSISAEWFAYLLFPLLALALIRVPRYIALMVAGLALAGTAAIFIIADWSLNTWVGPPALTRVAGEFLCGAALRRAVAAGRDQWRGAGDFLGTAAFLAFLIGASTGFSDFVLIGLLALTILGACVSRAYLAKILGSRLLVWLGEISYSIYMVHFPVLIVCRRFWEYAGFGGWGITGKSCAVLATTALIIALAATLYYLVERPARSRFRDRIGVIAAA